MTTPALNRARQFIDQETQFHLGFLPTEQSNPKSRTLEADFRSSPAQGVACLQRIDRDVMARFRTIAQSPEYAHLNESIHDTILHGGRVIFSGCGATGRLSILLEAMWRQAIASHPQLQTYQNSVESIMTGGDFALVRSVEFFEDYASFGRRQVQEARMSPQDTLVAITEGGETSSVLGTVAEALERGCQVFLLFNNPAKLLAEHLERSRQAIEDPRVTVLDLYCGPMALAGSTRMQATTSEQLVAGAALECAFQRLLGNPIPDHVAAFEALLASLEAPDCVKAIADYLQFEADIYGRHGKITYFADDFLLDIFTDTTERSPTFMLPPFRRSDDTISPPSWAFVKNPLYSTAESWQRAIRRPLRCLSWTPQEYAQMGAADQILRHPPRISAEDLLTIRIGNEDLAERYEGDQDAAVLVSLGEAPRALQDAFASIAPHFAHQSQLQLFPLQADSAPTGTLPVACASGPLNLMQHLAIKLALNTISTGTMALLGRISGNWMSWVDCTNKKLIDRGTRLLVELAGVDYRTACEALFEAMETQESSSGERPSPVQLALSRLRNPSPLAKGQA